VSKTRQQKRFQEHPYDSPPSPTTIMERIHADLHGPLKTSFESPASGAGSSNKKHTTKQYILMITDSYSKWTEFMALEDKSAATVAEAIWVHYFMRFGCPSVLVSDQGK
jgi:hypothetical protein